MSTISKLGADMTDELLPCPFCGEEEPDLYFVTGTDFCWKVKCRECGASRVDASLGKGSQDMRCRARAIEKWNRRALLARQPAAIDNEAVAFSADKCAQDVYDLGESIGLFDIPKETANAICEGITSATGVRVDWHYIAGRVHMKALATPLANEASKPAAQTLSDGAQFFACYLIDNCENEIVREESVQAWLGKMLASPRYHPAAPSVEQDERGALTCRQIESVTYEEYAKRRGDESDLDCILKVVKRCLGVADEPRNVEGMTRAEFGQHLNVCLQHDNVRRKERGIPEMTSDAMEAEIKERVERNYPAKCQGCAAFDNPDALDVHFVQGCEGCKARMQKVAGFGPLCDARAASTSANVAQLDMSLEARLTDAEADVKRLHAEKMELWNQVHGYSANVAQGAEAVTSLRRIAHELRTYNPAADEYKGENIHKVWAREIEALLPAASNGESK